MSLSQEKRHIASKSQTQSRINQEILVSRFTNQLVPRKSNQPSYFEHAYKKIHEQSAWLQDWGLHGIVNET